MGPRFRGDDTEVAFPVKTAALIVVRPSSKHAISIEVAI